MLFDIARPNADKPQPNRWKKVEQAFILLKAFVIAAFRAR